MVSPPPDFCGILIQNCGVVAVRVQEMATEFPHAHFISVDLVPMLPHVPKSNITFEIYDVYAGLAEPDESFDIIHARNCILSVSPTNGAPG